MPNWIDDYIDYTAAQESPPLFHRWCALSCIAAVLNRRVWLHRRSAEGVIYFTNYPGQLSICLVAGAGRCKKSTAVSIAKPFMKAAGVQLFDGKITPERLLNKLGTAPKPVLTIIASELSTFLSKASYSDGMIDNLIKLLDCESNPYETQKTSVVLNNPCVTLLMATTPFNMGKAIPPQAHDTGFLSRHLFIYSDKPGAAQPLSFNEADIDPAVRAASAALYTKLITQLRAFGSNAGEFIWTGRGQKWFDNYYASYRASSASDGEGYPQRRPDHLTRIAMCLQVATGGGLILTEEVLALADAWLTEIEADMSRAFAFIGQHADADKQETILRVFRQKAFETGLKRPIVDGQDLYWKVCKKIPSLQEMSALLSMLINAGIIGTMKHPTTNKNQYIMLQEPY